jgi:antitoxin (DNA-binding transcriptional repressor) of toxin-antitoxin stability system
MARQPIEFEGLNDSASALKVLDLVSKGDSVFVTNRGQGTFWFRPASETKPGESHVDIHPSEFASHASQYLEQVAQGKRLGIVKDGKLIGVISRFGASYLIRTSN